MNLSLFRRAAPDGYCDAHVICNRSDVVVFKQNAQKEHNSLLILELLIVIVGYFFALHSQVSNVNPTKQCIRL